MKILYLAVIDENRSSGVLKKIRGFVDSLRADNYEIEDCIIDASHGYLDDVKRKIDSISEGVIILRSLTYHNFFLIRQFRKARKRGVKIIIDVPTPNIIALKEFYLADKSIWIRLKAITHLLITGPVPFFYVDRIFQYSQEGLWFRFGNQRKIRLIGNGIDTKSISLQVFRPKFDEGNLVLISVSTIKPWHGIDLLIQAIGLVNSSSDLNRKVKLEIVGDGPLITSLQETVKTLGLEKDVTFHGNLEGEELFFVYGKAHVGVGSLGLHRIGLKVSSILKLREYCALGLPFIYAGIDPDFSEKLPFAFHVDSEENLSSLVKTINRIFERYRYLDRNDIRAYAESHLDFRAKIDEMLLGL